MSIRSWIAMLLLFNYLVVVGVGCMSRPEDQREFVLVQTSQEGRAYQECRYLRMDGLEDFLTEALANQYQSTPEMPAHHFLSVLVGVDAHYLTCTTWPLQVYASPLVTAPAVEYQCAISAGLNRVINAPPWLV